MDASNPLSMNPVLFHKFNYSLHLDKPMNKLTTIFISLLNTTKQLQEALCQGNDSSSLPF